MCQTSKESWDTLEFIHDGTFVVKKSRVTYLNRDFKLLHMEENETFGSFYARFFELVNTSYNLY